MFKRLLLGLLKGVLLGGVSASALIWGFGVALFPGPLSAYGAAVLTGAVCGLFAGRPVWAPNAKVEASLKAVAGAGLGAALMFALRQWVPMEIDLGLVRAGAGPVGSLAATTLPLVSTLLAVLFELDNTGSGTPETGRSKQRVEQRLRASVAADDQTELESEEQTRGQARLRH